MLTRLTILTGKTILLSSVPEFIETEAGLLLTFFLWITFSTFYCHILKVQVFEKCDSSNRHKWMVASFSISGCQLPHFFSFLVIMCHFFHFLLTNNYFFHFFNIFEESNLIRVCLSEHLETFGSGDAMILGSLFIHFEHFWNSWVAAALCENVVYEICIANTYIQIKYLRHNMLTSVLAISCPYYLGESKSCCSILNLVDSFDTIVKLT